jgi:hypothetical protein
MCSIDVSNLAIRLQYRVCLLMTGVNLPNVKEKVAKASHFMREHDHKMTEVMIRIVERTLNSLLGMLSNTILLRVFWRIKILIITACCKCLVC